MGLCFSHTVHIWQRWRIWLSFMKTKSAQAGRVSLYFVTAHRVFYSYWGPFTKFIFYWKWGFVASSEWINITHINFSHGSSIIWFSFVLVFVFFGEKLLSFVIWLEPPRKKNMFRCTECLQSIKINMGKYTMWWLIQWQLTCLARRSIKSIKCVRHHDNITPIPTTTAAAKENTWSVYFRCCAFLVFASHAFCFE